MKSKGILIGDEENINNHVLYVKGNAWIPQRFWDYHLYNINRPFDKDWLKSNNFLQIDLKETVEKYEGISWTHLKN